MIKLLNILNESLLEKLGTRKQIMGSGIQHDVYPFKGDPTKVIKISAYGDDIDTSYVKTFQDNPSITAKIFKVTNKYMIMEKLDTKKFLEEDEKVRMFLSKVENKLPYDSLLFIKTLQLEYPDVLQGLMKYADKNNKEVKSILERWVDFLERLKETGLEDLDIHNANLGYDKEGKLKLLDL
jgi:hypothetical protein